MNQKSILKRQVAAIIAAALLTGCGICSAQTSNVIRFNANGEQKASGETVNSVLSGYADGDRVVIYKDVNTDMFSLGGGATERKAITFESDSSTAVRTIVVKPQRFMDYGFGTFTFKNVKFKDAYAPNGGIFCRWDGAYDKYYQYLIGENAEFNNCRSTAAGGVSLSNPGIYLEGSFSFTNNTAKTTGGALSSSSAVGGVAKGGYIVFQGANSNMVFSGNKANETPNDVFADRFVTIKDSGTYSFGGGISTATLNIQNGAQVSLLSGSITKLTSLNIDTDSRLNLVVNDNNYVTAGATAFKSGATQFTVGSDSGAVSVTGSGLCPITIDCTGLTAQNDELLVMLGNTSGIQKPIIQSTGMTNGFAYLKSSDDKGLRLGVQAVTEGSTVYRYDSAGALQKSGTDFNVVGWATNNTYVLTGDATFTSQTNSNGLNITIQSNSDQVRKITATGTDGARKRLFDFGYGTYTLSNVEFNNIGLSNDMGCFAQSGTTTKPVSVIANNVTFKELKGNYAAVINSGFGIDLTGSIDFVNCTATNSTNDWGVVLNSSGGYVRFYGDGSEMSFSNNRTSSTTGADRCDIKAADVTFEDKGTYSLDGGITASTLNIQSGAQVSLLSGSVTKLTSLNIDTASRLNLVVNDNNYVTAGAAAFKSDATQFTVGSDSGAVSVTGSGLCPITIDCTGLSVQSSELLVMLGNTSGIQKPIIQSTGLTNALIYLKSSNDKGLRLGVQEVIEGSTVYRYDSSGTFQKSGTDFKVVGWATNNTYVLTGDATFTSQTNSNGLNITIQSNSDQVRKITATGTDGARKRLFDYGYGTYTLSNVEFNDIGLSNDMGCFAQSGTTPKPVSVIANNVTFNALKGSYAAVINSGFGMDLTGSIDFVNCTATNSTNDWGVVLNSSGGYVRFYGDGSEMSFSNNRTSSTTGADRCDIKAAEYVTFEDKGTYSLDGGITAPTLNVQNGAVVALEPGSVNKLTTGINVSGGSDLTVGGTMTAGAIAVSDKSALSFSALAAATIDSIVLDADSLVSVAVTDGNIVSTGTRTFGTDATKVQASQWTQGTIGNQAAFMVDPSSVSTAPASGKEVLVVTADLSAYQTDGNRIVVQTAPNDKYLAYFNTADSTGLTVGLKAKEGSKNVYLQKTDGTWTSEAIFKSLTADKGVTYVDADVKAEAQNLGSSGATVMRTYAIQSSSDSVRRLDASGQKRFFDWASGDWTISNIEFYGAGAGDEGSVFQNGISSKVPVYLYARNVYGTDLTGTYGAFIHSYPGTNLTGTLTVSGCKTTNTGGGVAIHVGDAYTARFYGDSSDMLFTNNQWSNGKPNDIKAGTVLFEDAGKYQFNSGIVAKTITASDSSRVVLGASSQSSATTLNLQDTTMLTVQSGATATADALNVVNSPTIDGDLTVGATGSGLVVKALNLGSDTDPGTLTVLGDYTQSNDVYLDVFSTDSVDKLYFGGGVEFLNDSQLIVRNKGALEIETTLDLILIDGAEETPLNEAFAHLDLSDFGDQIRWTTSLDLVSGGGYQLTLHGANSSSVPEPGSCVLLLLGVFGLYFCRRNRSR